MALESDTIEGEWSVLAEDDGTFVASQFTHSVVIGGDTQSEIVTSPTSISYSPTVNKVKNCSVDVPPDSSLENTSYLGEPFTLYVDGDEAFLGEIKSIETSQVEGEDYSLTAHPPGKKMSGSIVERDVDNEIVSDAASLLVDRFNEYDSDHKSSLGTETTSSVERFGGKVYRVVEGSTSGTLTFPSVGSDASNIDSLLVKVYTPVDSSVVVEIKTNSSQYNEGIFDLDKTVYGEWLRIEPSNLPSESYDIEFSISGDALVSNWISITDEVLKRDTEPLVPETVNENVDFYSRYDEGMVDTVDTIDDGLTQETDRIRNRQVSTWVDTSSANSSRSSSESYATQWIGGEAAYVAPNAPESASFNGVYPEDDFSQWDVYVRDFPYQYFVDNSSDHHPSTGNILDQTWNNDFQYTTDQVKINDEAVRIDGEAGKLAAWEYDRSVSEDELVFEASYYKNTEGSPEFALTRSQTGDEGYGIYNTSNTFYLRKYSGAFDSFTNLANDSLTVADNEWIDIELAINPDGTVEADISSDAGSITLTATDSDYSQFRYFKAYSETTDAHFYVDDMVGYEGFNEPYIHYELNIDGDTTTVTPDDTSREWRTWRWEHAASFDDAAWDDTFRFFDNITLTAITDLLGSNQTSFLVSGMVFVHNGSSWSDSDFDLYVHEPQGHLNEPYMYSWDDFMNTTVTFAREVSDNNLSESTTIGAFQNSSSPVSDWGPKQKADITSSFPPDYPNSDSVENSYPYPGITHQTRFKLSASGSRNNGTPRYGYQPMELTGFDVNIDINDLEVLFDESFSENRLSELNSLASDSTMLFRWEGDVCRIFHRGQRYSDIDLKSESISSSVSIEDVYESCEVIGMHGTRSGIIQSTQAPSYVDDHMQIRTEEVKTEADASNRARRFLQEHGSVKYKGSIDTLPTFAPLGNVIKGTNFNHGQDMVIQNVRYSKSGTSINLGYNKDVSGQLIALSSDTGSTKSRATGDEMVIPTSSSN